MTSNENTNNDNYDTKATTYITNTNSNYYCTAVYQPKKDQNLKKKSSINTTSEVTVEPNENNTFLDLSSPQVFHKGIVAGKHQTR